MSIFVLETDMLSLFQRGNPAVEGHVLATLPSDLAIAVITVDEQLTGWYSFIRKAKQVDKLALGYQRLAEMIPFLATFHVIAFDEPSIRRFESLRKLKLNVRKMDLRIAAVVLEIGATLVTRNARDFKQVPGLTFVDWSQ